ncbi:hypothetical protein T01_10663 [Trichinella spiralis]|uniref:Uncharacterized protein n=1 Tax=Trichinella spiralis TaxID=6334 RepID=A0A0V0Z1K6_TRISP|nr:hypothetical protein T01_10663 [Trichinella spiralis]
MVDENFTDAQLWVYWVWSHLGSILFPFDRKVFFVLVFLV